jgi:hypothetical protein
MRLRRLQRLLLAVLVALAAAPLHAQTIDDGLMMPKRQFCTGFGYAHDAWDRYWEGTLERGNGNVGTVTTQSVSWMGAYDDEAAISRLYGAIHYRSDIEAGKEHGERIGGYTVAFARADGAD